VAHAAADHAARPAEATAGDVRLLADGTGAVRLKPCGGWTRATHCETPGQGTLLPAHQRLTDQGEMKLQIRELLNTRSLDDVTKTDVRRLLEQKLKLPEGALDGSKATINKIIDEYMVDYADTAGKDFSKRMYQAEVDACTAQQKQQEPAGAAEATAVARPAFVPRAAAAAFVRGRVAAATPAPSPARPAFGTFGVLADAFGEPASPPLGALGRADVAPKGKAPAPAPAPALAPAFKSVVKISNRLAPRTFRRPSAGRRTAAPAPAGGTARAPDADDVL
jgi:hypothetical protein